MDMKLLSEMAEGIVKVVDQVKQLERERDAWESRALVAEQMLEWVEDFTVSAKIKEAAAEQGITPKDWIGEKLTEAIQPKTELPIDPMIYEMFTNMAHGRSLSLTEFGRSVGMTDLFMELFDNRRI